MIITYESIITRHAFLIALGLFETVTIIHYIYGDLDLDVNYQNYLDLDLTMYVDILHRKRLIIYDIEERNNNER